MSIHTVDDLQLSVTEKGNIESIPVRSASSTAVVQKAIQSNTRKLVRLRIIANYAAPIHMRENPQT